MKLHSINTLLIDDNEGDIRLVQEALKENKLNINLNVARDGIEALEYLHQEGKHHDAKLPDLILLDLNMPRMDGRETLEKIKGDAKLKRIPIVVLTTSSSDEDILSSYKSYANAYITKPVDFDKFLSIIKQIEEFWFTIVNLPSQKVT